MFENSQELIRPLARGALIVLEGVDRSGKSTQAQKLINTLGSAGYPALLVNFPNRTTLIGQVLNKYLTKEIDLEEHAVHLLFSANRWEQEPFIRQKIQEGFTLIIDRYVFSGIAFSSTNETLSFNWCKQSEIGLPKPDVVFFLQLNLKTTTNRPEFGRERFDNRDVQEKALQCYYRLMKDRSINWIVEDASSEIETLHQQIKTKVKKIIHQVRYTPLDILWDSSPSKFTLDVNNFH